MQDVDMIEPVCNREEVYTAIDSERRYQAEIISKDASLCRTIPKGVGDYIVMLQGYQNRLAETWISTPGKAESLRMIRKIAAIAVKCMEQHGAPHRNMAETPSHKQE